MLSPDARLSDIQLGVNLPGRRRHVGSASHGGQERQQLEQVQVHHNQRQITSGRWQQLKNLEQDDHSRPGSRLRLNHTEQRNLSMIEVHI